MSSTQFVEMYHPLIPLTITSPVRVAMQAVDDRAAKGWLLVDPEGVLPTPDTPYYTKEALLSQIQGGAAPIGTALRAALGLSVAATVSTNATLAANRHTPVDATSGARTMTLPTGQPEGTRIIVEKVDSSTNAITVSGSIRGSAGTVSLVGQYETLSFLADSAGSWHPGPGHKTKAYLDSKYVPLGVNNVVIGNGGMANPLSSTNTALTAAANIQNPNLPFLGALSGFAFYGGTQGGSAGSLQGGAAEAYAAMNGTVTQAVLGFESVGVGVGNTGNTGPQGSYPSIIGLQGTAFVQGDVSATSLTAILARAPFANTGAAGTGAPTVGTAYSIRAQEPTVGTQQHTFYGEGRHTFSKGTHASIIEILGNAQVRRWAVLGADLKWTGYASDGTSVRVHIDSADNPTDGRFKSALFSGTEKHITATLSGSETFSVRGDGLVSLRTAGTTGTKTVEVGAADSGGTGYRMLRVTN